MKRKTFNFQLWQYVLDSSSLINIQQNEGVRILERRKGAILISEKIAEEVALDPRIRKSDPLRQFVLNNLEIITQFKNGEEEEYLRILKQQGIDPGEASAMAIALKRGLPLVIDDTKATGKAQNHGIKTWDWKKFVRGS
jgi:predicted nucleic acid-binding protein